VLSVKVKRDDRRRSADASLPAVVLWQCVGRGTRCEPARERAALSDTGVV